MVPRAVAVSAALALALSLSGCGEGETIRLFEPVEVKVAVPVKAAPPPELMQPYRAPALPDFMPPSDPRARFCVDPLGAANLKGLTHDLLKRDGAWREWAATPLSTAPLPAAPLPVKP